VGEACGTHGRGEKSIKGFDEKSRGKETTWKNLREIGLGGVDWIRLAQDRDRWRAVVNAAMNLRVLEPRS
jgi:hypothetical protein